MATNFTAKIDVNFSKIRQSIEVVNQKAIAAVATEALKDANYYARHDTGEMIRSSITASQPEKGMLVWDTPYANKVYLTGTPATDKNPNASLMWAHKGYSQNIGKYNEMVRKMMIGRRPVNG